MGIEQIKMAYSTSQLRLRISFPLAVCQELKEPPQALFNKAKVKFVSEQQNGVLALYEIKEDVFKTLWQEIRKNLSAKSINPETQVVFNFAVGAPSLKGLMVKASPDPAVAYTLTIKADAVEASTWRFDWLRLNLKDLKQQANIPTKENMAQVYGIWLRLCRGESIVDEPVSIYHEPPRQNEQQVYSIIGNKARGELILIIWDQKAFRSKTLLQEIIASCKGAVKKLTAVTGVPIEFLNDALLERIKAGVNGTERFGIGLPAQYIIAIPAIRQDVAVQKIAQAQMQASPSSVAQAPRPATTGDYPGAGMLRLSVSDDKMSASIEGFDVALYEHPDFTVDIQWIKNEIKRYGIRVPIPSQVETELQEKISKGLDLSGVCIARGIAPEAGEGPYLHPSYKDAPKVATQAEKIDIREAQQRDLVKAGGLVAEIRYKKPMKMGRDIYGHEVWPEGMERLVVNVGEGIEVRDDDRYYALYDGIPKVEENSVELLKSYVIEGDVNLRTGNIHFDGPVEIHGSIDSGSVVECSGDLVVEGTIRDAFVRVGGNLEAKGGIITGEKGRVRVAHDLNAAFIENSNIICGGNIHVKKAIINSQVVCGGCVELDQKEGVLGGGHVSVRTYLRTGSLGFERGSKTQVVAGVDWRAFLAVNIREARLAKIKANNQEIRNAMRELMQKKVKTQKHKDMIEEFRSKLEKQRTVIERATKHLENARSKISYDKESRVFIHETLFANCSIEVGGVVIPVNNNVAGVMLSPKRSRGSYIHPIEEEDDENQAKKVS